MIEQLEARRYRHRIIPKTGDDALMRLFQKGQPKIGGRRKGTRDRIATALLEAIAKPRE